MSSQYGQDSFVLGVLGGVRGGFFLDTGASDGVDVSNTLALERDYGWTGICVEPNARFFAQLERNRRCLCLNCCIYDSDSTVDFVEADSLGGIAADYQPGFASYVTRSLGRADGDLPEPVPKSALSVRSLLQRARAPRIIDYWSLDTEGSELRILRAFPFDEFCFRVLTVEHNWLPVRDDIRRFLTSRGYRWVVELGCDDGYVLGEARAAPAWQSKAWARGRA